MDPKKITKICDNAIFYFTCGLIYFLPISTGLTEWGSGLIITTFFLKRTLLYFIGNRQNTFDGIRVSMKTRFKEFFRAYKPAALYLSLPLGAFIFLNFLSVIVSQYPALSWKGFVFKLLQGVFILFGVVEGIKTRKQIGIFIVIFFLSALVVGSNGIYQAINGAGFIQGREVLEGRLRSSLKHANDFGGYLIVVFPLVLSVLLLWVLPLRKKKTAVHLKKIKDAKNIFFQGLILGALSVVLFICLGLTFSRGAWFGFFVALILIGWFQRKTILPLALIAVLFGVMFFSGMNNVRHMHIGRYAHHLQADSSLLSKSFGFLQSGIGSGMGRTGFWREALMIIRDFPVFGTGLNTYSKVGTHYKINWGGYPHNCYLQMAAETGVMGLGAFIWIIFAIFKNSIQSMKRMQDPLLFSVLLGLLAGLAGFLTHSFFDTNFYSVQLGALCWLVLGIIISIPKIVPFTPD